jgi:hypothetical protein
MAYLNFFDFASRKTFWVIGIFTIIGAVVIPLRVIYGSYLPNKNFFQWELHGTVQKIHTIPRCNSYLIGNAWYLIKGDCIDYINIGDSIATDKNSYYLSVFEKGTDSIKYSEEVKTIVFEHVGNGEIPKITWKHR